MVARADFIRTLLELALDVVKGGEVRCGGSRAAPAPYLVDPVEDCDEGGGTCVREQQLRYRVAAQMGGNSSEVVRTIKQTAHTTWRRESVSLVGEGGVGG